MNAHRADPVDDVLPTLFSWATSFSMRGAHPRPHRFRSSGVCSRAEHFENILRWLMLNRQGLDILVHPLTDNSYDDHSRYAVWLGSPVSLKLNAMRRAYRAEQYPTPH